MDGEATKGAAAKADIRFGELMLSAPGDLTPSMEWDFESQTTGVGLFAVAQLVTSVSCTYTTNDIPAKTFTAFVQKAADGSIIKPSFPLADGNTIFYSPPAATAAGFDTPRMPGDAGLSSGSYNIAFKDYIMFCPNNGIWVPYESWTWSENIREDMINKILTPSIAAAPTTTPIVPESNYPQWSDYTDNWRAFVQIG